MLLNSSEENGVTTLRFNRKLNTTDQEQDVVIQVDNVMLICMTTFFSSLLLFEIEGEISNRHFSSLVDKTTN